MELSQKQKTISQFLTFYFDFNFFFFFFFFFALSLNFAALFKKVALNKQGATHKNTCSKIHVIND